MNPRDTNVIARQVTQEIIVKSLVHLVYLNHVKIMEDVLIETIHSNVNVHLIIKANFAKYQLIYVKQSPILVYV